MNSSDKIYVAGHLGLVGSAIVRALQKSGYTNLIVRTRKELDLLDERSVSEFFKTERPAYVFMAAAKVGGILANRDYPGDFIFQNISIQNNVIHNSYLTGVKKLLFLGSSCAYPRLAPQPMKEEYLLTGPVEETNYAFAIAKIAGIALCESYRKQYGCNFINVMPANAYGPHDTFDVTRSHVIPALIKKFEDAKLSNEEKVVLWGTGTPRREFLYVDDLGQACIFLMKNYDEAALVNVGTGEDISIHDTANMLKSITGFKGMIEWDTTKPDGTPRKLLDVSKIQKLGWHHETELLRGLTETYRSYQKVGGRNVDA